MAKKSTKRKKQRTAIQKEYAKQRDRIRKFISRAEARGYLFNEDAVPGKKRPTRKAIEELAYLTPERLYARAYRLDIETGELVHGNRAREEEKRDAARKAADTRRRNKEANKAFWTGQDLAKSQKAKNVEQQTPQSKQEAQAQSANAPEGVDYTPPDGGEIIFNNIVGGFLARLSDACQPNTTGAPRQQALNDTRARAESLITRAVDEAVAKHGKSGVGWLIQDNSDELGTYIEIVAYASTEGQIEAAAYRIVEVLKKELNLQERTELEEKSAEFEDWEEP